MSEILQGIIIAVVLAFCAYYISRRVRRRISGVKDGQSEKQCGSCEADCPLKGQKELSNSVKASAASAPCKR